LLFLRVAEADTWDLPCLPQSAFPAPLGIFRQSGRDSVCNFARQLADRASSPEKGETNGSNQNRQINHRRCSASWQSQPSFPGRNCQGRRAPQPSPQRGSTAAGRSQGRSRQQICRTQARQIKLDTFFSCSSTEQWVPQVRVPTDRFSSVGWRSRL
jgi:hypothetical protein